MEERGGCYCEALWKDPKYMRRRKIPPGFCGICRKCGQPGHTRHSPLPVPGTDTLCDECHDRLANDYDAWREQNPAGYTVDFVQRRERVRPNKSLRPTRDSALARFFRHLRPRA